MHTIEKPELQACAICEPAAAQALEEKGTKATPDESDRQPRFRNKRARRVEPLDQPAGEHLSQHAGAKHL